MDKLAKLMTDIGKLWANYSTAYFTGIRNTLILAVAATLAGCLIGLLCGVLNTIPYSRQDHPAKRFFLRLLRALIRIYVEVFRGTPMVLQSVFIFYGLPYFTDGALEGNGTVGKVGKSVKNENGLQYHGRTAENFHIDADHNTQNTKKEAL